jgi:hypothetical protein
VIFEALRDSSGRLHFSDKEVALYDMLDYRYYCLWIEKIKMAFIAAYAIFDKIAYLVNRFWNLQLKAGSVTFQTVWHEAAQTKKPLAQRLVKSNNWPLRGLFWLSRDLFFTTASSFRLDPYSRELYEIRNQITHKYLRVHSEQLYDAAGARAAHGVIESYPVSQEELKAQAVKLLKLVRSALIYVSLAAHWDQTVSNRSPDKRLILEMPLWTILDRHRL